MGRRASSREGGDNSVSEGAADGGDGRGGTAGAGVRFLLGQQLQASGPRQNHLRRNALLPRRSARTAGRTIFGSDVEPGFVCTACGRRGAEPAELRAGEDGHPIDVTMRPLFPPQRECGDSEDRNTDCVSWSWGGPGPSGIGHHSEPRPRRRRGHGPKRRHRTSQHRLKSFGETRPAQPDLIAPLRSVD